MKKSENPGILHIHGDRDLRLFETGHFLRVCNDLPRPRSQIPRLIHFVGQYQKTLALKNILANNNTPRSPTDYFAGLRADISTFNHDSPLLFLDSDPSGSTTELPLDTHRPFQSYPLLWLQNRFNSKAVSDALHARLLFTFVDVVCIFLDDFLDHASLFKQLGDWSRLGAGSNHDSVIRPRLLIVLAGNNLPVATERRLQKMQDSLLECFSMVQPVFLAAKELSIIARYQRLKEAVLTHSVDIYNLKQERHLSFSAVHLAEFFRVATNHCAKTLTAPFDFLSVARPLAGQQRDVSQHLLRFFQLCQRHHVSYSDIVLAIASALLVDAYPPRMHIFDPTWVFRQFYQQPCSLAFQKCDPELCDSYCESIATAFAQFTEALQKGQSSVELRAALFHHNPKPWAPLKSNLTCLYCLINSPEPPGLPCGHAFCENCILRRAINVPHLESHFHLDRCYICQSPVDITVKVKPREAGIRIVASDGGGTRGVIPLESLILLQELLGPLPVRDCFELGIGTSSGGLIQLGIFALPMDLDTCSKLFDNISQKVFGVFKKSTSLVTSVRRIFRYWTADAVHDPVVYEDNLKSTLGPHARLFGAPHGPTSGYKCAVVASSIIDGAPVLLSNYNGAAADGLQDGYELLRPQNLEEEPHIWEAARATSAAPGLFPTAKVGSRHLQDGGLRHNNPSLLAWWESRRLWPEIKTPDLFLSLGTGQPKRYDTKNTHFRNFLLDGFIPRLLRSSITKTDGDIHWAHLMNSLDDQSRGSFIRANIPLSGPALIADPASMPRLRQAVRQDFKLWMNMFETAKIAIVSSFFFKLDRVPSETRWGYLVQGSIRCRNNIIQVLGAMTKLGITSVEYSTETENLSSLEELDTNICDSCHRYRKNVHFYVHDLSQRVYIFMRSRTMARHKISGFPETINWFTRQQGLSTGAVFGEEHHGIPGAFQCPSCDMSSGSHHKRTMMQNSAGMQKRVKVHETILEAINEED